VLPSHVPSCSISRARCAKRRNTHWLDRKAVEDQSVRTDLGRLYEQPSLRNHWPVNGSFGTLLPLSSFIYFCHLCSEALCFVTLTVVFLECELGHCTWSRHCSRTVLCDTLCYHGNKLGEPEIPTNARSPTLPFSLFAYYGDNFPLQDKHDTLHSDYNKQLTCSASSPKYLQSVSMPMILATIYGPSYLFQE
jgi:hypothetical protein